MVREEVQRNGGFKSYFLKIEHLFGEQGGPGGIRTHDFFGAIDEQVGERGKVCRKSNHVSERRY